MTNCTNKKKKEIPPQQSRKPTTGAVISLRICKLRKVVTTPVGTVFSHQIAIITKKEKSKYLLIVCK